MTIETHFDLVEAPTAFKTAKEVLQTLEGVPFTVVGGWAVFANGSEIPSVDLDIWFHSDDHDAVYGAFLDQHDIQLDTPGGQARFNLDMEYADSSNELFGEVGSFHRGSLATEKRNLLGHQVSVLTGPDLLFSKAKAFHDRSQQWAISRDPRRLAALNLRDPTWAAFIRDRGESYWLRKAGKDLADVRYLQTLYKMGGPLDLRPIVEAPLVDPAPALVAWARTSG